MRSSKPRLVLTSAALAVTLGVGCDSETKDKVAALEQQVATLSQTQSEQAEAGAQHAAALAAATVRIDALEKQVATAESEAVALGQQVVSLEQKATQLQERADELELMIAEVKTKKTMTVGVPECDDYIAKYHHCIDDKMPEAAREASHKALETSIDAWRSAAKTEAGREALATACKSALDAVAKVCGLEEAP